MSIASVNIDALATLTSVIKKAHDEILADQQQITSQLNGGPVDTSGLAKLTEHAAWFQDQGTLLKNQLGYARWLESSTPGIQGTVRFEQSAVANLDYKTAKPLADKVKALMKEGPPPSDELLKLLKKYGGNPTFALLVMHGYRVGDGQAGMTLGPSPDLAYLKELGKGPNSEKFLQLYSQMLGGLSSEFPPKKLDSNDPSDYRAMALLASRDSWDKTWLVQLGNDMIKAERDDPQMWTKSLIDTNRPGHYDDVVSVVEPGGLEVKDPMVWLMDAMTRNPQAAADFFNGGGDAPIKANNGQTVQIGANLRFLTLERPWPQDSALGLMMAMGAANLAHDQDFDADFTALQHLDPKEKEHWYSFLGHLGLDIIGLVPELGDWADGANIAWYLAEGNYVDAGFAGAATIPVFGTSATIAKWIRRLNKLGEAGGHVLDAAELKKLIEELPYADQDPSKIRPADGKAPSIVPPNSIFLADVDDKPWYDTVGKLERGGTYVVGQVVFHTDGEGHIDKVEGDQSALTQDERDWIKKHSNG